MSLLTQDTVRAPDLQTVVSLPQRLGTLTPLSLSICKQSDQGWNSFRAPLPLHMAGTSFVSSPVSVYSLCRKMDTNGHQKMERTLALLTSERH